MKKFYYQSGFSLIGVIIALFIASIGMATIFALSNYALGMASSAKMKTIASGLAQEGAEIVRGLRDQQGDWNDWYALVATGDYQAQYNSNTFPLNLYSDSPLKIDANGLYQYPPCIVTCADSPFYRKISLYKKPELSDDEIKVVVEVKWLEKNSWHSLILENRLWNWQ